MYNCTPGVNPVQLESLSVPPLVQNGTVPHVVLDCPYSLSKVWQALLDLFYQLIKLKWGLRSFKLVKI